MTDLFLRLLNMSITAGWLILAVCLFRIVFKNAPKFFRCILWGLVALRLILPFSMESVLSLIPKTPPVTMASDQFDFFGSAQNTVDNVSPIISNDTSVVPAGEAAASVDPMLIISYVWLAGVICMLFYSLFSFIKVKRGVAESVLLEKNIYECAAQSPFVLGLFRPKIYLPFGVDENERAFVIAHEEGHIKRGDHWYKPVGFLILAVYWFNPLMWLAFILLCRDIELACDEKVIRQFSSEEKKDYSRTLLSLSVSRKSISACPVAFGETDVKRRVKGVLSYKRPAFWIIIIAVIVCAAITVGFLTDPKEKNTGYKEGDFLSFYDSIEFDIDGDGNKELCSLGMGPTSGVFTFTFFAQREKSDGFYLNIFLSNWGEPSFEKSAFGNKLYVKLDSSENGGEERLYEARVENNEIVLCDPDGELNNLMPGGAHAKAFLEGAFVENTATGYIPSDDSSWGITLSAEDVTPIGMTLKLKQEGGELGEGAFIAYDYYEIQVFSNGEWKSLFGFDNYSSMQQIVIVPGGEYEWSVNWFDYCGYLENSYTAGLYRIFKTISFFDNSSTEPKMKKTFYAYFAVPSPDGLEFSKSMSAYLDNDWEQEDIKVSFFGEDTFSLEVIDNEKTVWEKKLGLYHGDQKAYYLYVGEEKTRILEFYPKISNGNATYVYTLYLYDGKKMIEEMSNSVSFSINGREHLPIDEILTFYDEICELLGQSIGLVSTVNNRLSAGEKNIDDSFSWLNNAADDYTADDTFAGKLQKYDERSYNNYHS
ncbi:MAG: hypothetical protein J1E34_01850 [Oscillospiraceae bacterium]|nr:hypothetical protein [Oscillospiraceae bacterium]